MLLEVCVESAAALAICQGVADRIELCSGLDIGGLTPSRGLMQQAKVSGLETHVLIRPQVGDFAFDQNALEMAIADIKHTKAVGLHGVVIGATADGALDQDALQKMLQATDGLTKTLHRAFDVVEDQFAALDTAIAMGFDRILTSGGATTAYAGRAQLAELNTYANGRIEIMAGSGVNSANIAEIVADTGLTSFHASCTSKRTIQGKIADLGFGQYRRTIDKAELLALKTALSD
jgi:copper homeostasis protein